MATAIQKNGIKSLTNGSITMHELESAQVIKSEPVELYQVQPQTPEPESVKTEPTETTEAQETTETTETEDEIDIYINNVVTSFSVRCHLKLRDIALTGSNVIYKRTNGVNKSTRKM